MPDRPRRPESTAILRPSGWPLSLALLLAPGCSEPESHPELVGPRNLVRVDEPDDHPLDRTTYVPIYSSLSVADRARPVDMVVTLSLRNISLDQTVVVSTIDYYDSDGEPLRSYLEGTHSLGPMQSAEFVIARDDRTGGSGANFLVEWRSGSSHEDLVVEAVHHGRDGAVGLSFLAHGRVVSNFDSCNCVEPAPVAPAAPAAQ
jgi:hypothetical protein